MRGSFSAARRKTLSISMSDDLRLLLPLRPRLSALSPLAHLV